MIVVTCFLRVKKTKISCTAFLCTCRHCDNSKSRLILTSDLIFEFSSVSIHVQYLTFTYGVFPLSCPRARQRNRIESQQPPRHPVGAGGAEGRDKRNTLYFKFRHSTRLSWLSELLNWVPTLAARHCRNIWMIFSAPHTHWRLIYLKYRRLPQSTEDSACTVSWDMT